MIASLTSSTRSKSLVDPSLVSSTHSPEIRGHASAFLALGLHVSFAGMVTFSNKSLNLLREAAKTVPLDRMLVETDSPYLSPHPARGRPNQPAHLVWTMQYLAQLLRDLCRGTGTNHYGERPAPVFAVGSGYALTWLPGPRLGNCKKQQGLPRRYNRNNLSIEVTEESAFSPRRTL